MGIITARPMSRKVVFAGVGLLLLAINAHRGQLLWRAPHDDYTASSPAIWQSLVIVSSHAGTVTAYKQENGEKVWRVRIAAKVESSPVVVDGLAYFGSTDGRLIAV